jgi:hypothetical protein
MPTWRDLSTAALAPNFAKLWGFQFDAKTGDFVGRLAGKNVREQLGANFWGGSLKGIRSGDALRDSHLFLFRVVSIPAAGRCNGRLVRGDLEVRGERIALPLAFDGSCSDADLGASHHGGQLVRGRLR